MWHYFLAYFHLRCSPRLCSWHSTFRRVHYFLSTLLLSSPPFPLTTYSYRSSAGQRKYAGTEILPLSHATNQCNFVWVPISVCVFHVLFQLPLYVSLPVCVALMTKTFGVWSPQGRLLMSVERTPFTDALTVLLVVLCRCDPWRLNRDDRISF